MHNKHLKDLEALVHDIPLAKRKALSGQLDRLGDALGIPASERLHLLWPVASWPNRGERSLNRADALRYSVSFAYGENPDYRSFAATFEEVRHLLEYTRDSCKVAFGSNRGRIDRTDRPTKLGPCVITRLPHEIQLSDYPGVLPFQVKLDEAAETRETRKRRGAVKQY